jgi:hypothetical protein
VPWDVATGAAALKVTFWEQQRAEVEFVGVWGHQSSAVVLPVEIVVPHVVSDAPRIALRPVRDDDRYRLVRLSFAACYWIRVEPMSSEETVIDYSAFDTSALPQLEDAGTAEEFVRTFQREWAHSGICPDPKFYEVLDGEWLRSVPNRHSRLRQFLFAGVESSVHVLAQQWTWSTVGALDDW